MPQEWLSDPSVYPQRILSREITEMRKKLFVLVALIMVLAAVAIPASAGPPGEAAGDWEYLPTSMTFEFVGGNTVVYIVDEGHWTGTFDGSPGEDYAVSVETGVTVVHPSGHAVYKGSVLFESVTVNGRTGGLEMRVNGRTPSFGSVDWEGMWVIIGGEGELEGLHGEGKWWGPGYNLDYPEEWGEIHYGGNVHFEP
jgi:hypothetical protein